MLDVNDFDQLRIGLATADATLLAHGPHRVAEPDGGAEENHARSQ